MVRISANSKVLKCKNKKVDFIRSRLTFFKEDPRPLLLFEAWIFTRQPLSENWSVFFYQGRTQIT